MKEVLVRYRYGLPTEKVINELIGSHFGRFAANIYVSGAYRHNGTIVWQNTGVNPLVDSFVSLLTDNGIKVKDYDLYKSPTVGHIWLEKR